MNFNKKMAKRSLVQRSQNNKFGIYLHIPWCRRRCSYCDFYFEIQKQASAHYADRILEELARRKKEFPYSELTTLYFGGGTPSLLPEEQIQKVIEGIKNVYNFAEDIEITLEANPEDLLELNPQTFLKLGINRLSLGIQSFDNKVLKQLGRAHTGEQAEQVLKIYSKFYNCSVDLIIGVPSEQPSRLEHDIEIATNSGAQHISSYMLTVEENTPLKKWIDQKKYKDVDDDFQADAYEEIQHRLHQKGFRQYEISSFCIPGLESKHNRIYWGQGEYLGLGPGAHSMQLLKNGAVKRTHNSAKWQEYADRIQDFSQQSETLTASDAFKEAVAFALRDLLNGADLENLAQKHQASKLQQQQLEGILNYSVADLHLTKSKNIFKITKKGTLFADAIARNILAVSI